MPWTKLIEPILVTWVNSILVKRALHADLKGTVASDMVDKMCTGLRLGFYHPFYGPAKAIKPQELHDTFPMKILSTRQYF